MPARQQLVDTDDLSTSELLTILIRQARLPLSEHVNYSLGVIRREIEKRSFPMTGRPPRPERRRS